MNEQELATLLKEIAESEERLLQDKKLLTELRRRIPREPVKNYTLKGAADADVPLLSLFGDRDELTVIHNMGKSCRFCTLWADGFNGVFEHLYDRAVFVVVSPDDPATQKEFKESRGWKFEMYSAQGSDFTKDMGFEKDGKPWPGVSTFEKTADGTICRVARASFGPGDDFCSVWPLLDLLPKGTDGWEPQYKYTSR